MYVGFGFWFAFAFGFLSVMNSNSSELYNLITKITSNMNNVTKTLVLQKKNNKKSISLDMKRILFHLNHIGWHINPSLHAKIILL